MALSTEEFNELVAKVKAALEAGSLGVVDVPKADTLDGVTSLPALQLKGAGRVVLVPLTMLSDPVYEAIAAATPDYAAFCKKTYAEYVQKLLAEAQKYYPVQEDGWYWTDEASNVSVSITDKGLDASLLSDRLKALIKSIPGLGLALGIEPGTAYAGDKGNTLNKLVNSMRWLHDLAEQVQEDGFAVSDAAGNVGLRYDNNGLDAALLSDHLKDLVKEIDGLGLALGLTQTTAYPGDKGKQNSEDILKLKAATTTLRNIVRFLSEVCEEGFYVADAAGNVGLKYDADGLDAAKLSGNFMSLLRAVVEAMNISIEGLVEVDEDGIYFIDANANVAVSVTNAGLNWAMSDSSSGGLGYEVVSEIDYDV